MSPESSEELQKQRMEEFPRPAPCGSLCRGLPDFHDCPFGWTWVNTRATPPNENANRTWSRGLRTFSSKLASQSVQPHPNMSLSGSPWQTLQSGELTSWSNLLYIWGALVVSKGFLTQTQDTRKWNHRIIPALGICKRIPLYKKKKKKKRNPNIKWLKKSEDLVSISSGHGAPGCFWRNPNTKTLCQVGISVRRQKTCCTCVSAFHF